MTIALKKKMKRNDTSPPIRAQILNDSDGQPLDLTGASVMFHMMDEDGVLQVDEPGVIESPETEGFVRYDWAVGDTATAGVFDAEFEVTLAGGAKETHPVGEHIEIRIVEDLDNG